MNDVDLLGWTVRSIHQSIPPGLSRPRALEIGPGTGALTERLRPVIERLGSYEVVEPSSEMANRFRKRCRGITVQECSWQDLTDVDQRYDMVVARMVLRHEVDPSDAVQRWARMVRRGGALVIVEGPPPSRTYDVEVFYGAAMALKHGSHRHVIFASDIVDQLLDCGMNVTTYERFTDGNSLRQWLEAGAVPTERAQSIFQMHQTSRQTVRDAYRMQITDDDVLMRWRQCVVIGHLP